MKYCTKCKQILEIDKFYVSYPKDRPNPKISSYCKECTLLSKKITPKFIKRNCIICNKEFETKFKHKSWCGDYHKRLFDNKTYDDRLKQKLNRKKEKIKCKDKYQTRLTDKEKKLIFDFTKTPKEVQKKIKRPSSTIYKMRWEYKLNNDIVFENDISSKKKKINKKEAIKKYNILLANVWNKLL